MLGVVHCFLFTSQINETQIKLFIRLICRLHFIGQLGENAMCDFKDLMKCVHLEL